VTCRVQGGFFEAFYSPGAGTRTMVCQYDIDLGFTFDTIRLFDRHGPPDLPEPPDLPDDRVVFRSMASAGHTTDVSNLLSFDWGAGVVVGGRGDALIGSAAHPGPVLGLGQARGQTGDTSEQFPRDAEINWPDDHVASTTPGQVLRLQLSESGSQDEGYRWTGGRIYVRAGGVVAGAAR
jgi:hypothetical protein